MTWSSARSCPPPAREPRAAVGVGATVTVAAVTLAAVQVLGGAGSVDRREGRGRGHGAGGPAPETIEHILVQYRMDSGETFIEYELDRGRRRVLSSDGGGYAGPGAEHAVDAVPAVG